LNIVTSRPSFEQILVKIDELVVTNSIKDKVARNLWKILKETETASHYPFYAEWDNFIEVLCGALGLPLDTIPPESTIYQCAKAILGTAPIASVCRVRRVCGCECWVVCVSNSSVLFQPRKNGT
jgi:hypothetical protein